MDRKIIRRIAKLSYPMDKFLETGLNLENKNMQSKI